MKDDCNHRHCIRGLTTYKSPVNNSVTSRSLETHESNNFRIHVKSSAETDVRAAKTSARYFYWRWNKTELVVLKKLNRLYFTQILLNTTVKTSLFLVCVAGEDSRKLRERNEITGFCCCFVPRENYPPTAQASRQLSPRSEFLCEINRWEHNARYVSEIFVWKWRLKYSREVCHVLEKVTFDREALLLRLKERVCPLLSMNFPQIKAPCFVQR